MMKKIKNILLFLSFATFLVSCASSKEGRTYKKMINGNWQLQTVTTEGITGTVNIKLFNEADFNCFVGSNWNFNNTNSLGSYDITKSTGECVALKRNIRWTVYEEKNEPKLLQFKRLDNKYKAMDNGDGFRFTIVSIEKTTMQLKSNISFEGKTVWIVYNFIKN